MEKFRVIYEEFKEFVDKCEGVKVRFKNMKVENEREI